MLSDLRYACRQFAKLPGFALVVVLSLAIGIGANATVICWFRSLVSHTLPAVPVEDRLAVMVSNVGGGCVSLPDLRDFGSLDNLFEGTAAAMPTSACLKIGDRYHWIHAQVVSAGFFDLLGVKPLLGRTFLAGEDQHPGGDTSIVLGERLWRTEFAADPAIIGRTVEINRVAFTVVGVVPAAFQGTTPPLECSAWAPLSMLSEVRNQDRGMIFSRSARGWHNLVLLRPGVSLKQAQAAVAAASPRLSAEYPNTNRDVQHRLVPLSECPWGSPTIMGPALRVLIAVALGAQLIVTANIANLMLARATGRRKEIAIRLATGASRARLIRQLLLENLLYAAAGGCLGVFLAWNTINAFPALLPAEIAGKLHTEFSFDLATLGWITLLTAGTGLLFGLAPALQCTRPDLVEALKEGGKTSGGGGHNRLRNTLVVVEISLTFVLLFSAGIAIRSLRSARTIDVGFNADHVIIGKMQIGMNGYDRETGKGFYRALQNRLAADPAVEDAALVSWLPLGLSGCKGTDVDVPGRERLKGESLSYEYAIVSPRYFSTLKIPLVAGRDFTEADNDASTPVAIVNEVFARRFWPDQDPLGKQFRSGGKTRTVIGVARAGKYNRVNEAPWCFLYLPYLQGVPDLDLNVCVRTRSDPASFAASLRSAVHSLDPQVDVFETSTLAAHSSMALFPEMMASNLLLMLGAVSLLLAALGVYAVMAYSVGRRMQEFGVRIALGAEPSSLLRLVFGQSLLLAASGVAAGLLLSLGLVQMLKAFLTDVKAFDPAILACAAGILCLVAVMAAWIPARRATRADPIDALRAE